MKDSEKACHIAWFLMATGEMEQSKEILDKQLSLVDPAYSISPRHVRLLEEFRNRFGRTEIDWNFYDIGSVSSKTLAAEILHLQCSTLVNSGLLEQAESYVRQAKAQRYSQENPLFLCVEAIIGVFRPRNEDNVAMMLDRLYGALELSLQTSFLPLYLVVALIVCLEKNAIKSYTVTKDFVNFFLSDPAFQELSYYTFVRASQNKEFKRLCGDWMTSFQVHTEDFLKASFYEPCSLEVVRKSPMFGQLSQEFWATQVFACLVRWPTDLTVYFLLSELLIGLEFWPSLLLESSSFRLNDRHIKTMFFSDSGNIFSKIPPLQIVAILLASPLAFKARKSVVKLFKKVGKILRLNSLTEPLKSSSELSSEVEWLESCSGCPIVELFASAFLRLSVDEKTTEVPYLKGLVLMAGAFQKFVESKQLGGLLSTNSE
eukprot:GHVP01053618.1.p1 GENE.GHVP01053618.1~~GHVP01053618.1.p1  ORF type:complete len:430 (+),score=72.75 GHVP01053618.1:40-1329(+)